MKLTQDEILHVARLAHLELSAAEVEGLGRQLSEILTYIDKLNQLDTSGVEPLAQVMAAFAATDGVLRDDEEAPCGIASEVLKTAPEPAPPYFRVPKVIERG